MDEEMRREIEAMPPDIEELEERITALESEAGEGADALAKIKDLEQKFRLMADEIRTLSDAVGARR